MPFGWYLISVKGASTKIKTNGFFLFDFVDDGLVFDGLFILVLEEAFDFPEKAVFLLLLLDLFQSFLFDFFVFFHGGRGGLYLQLHDIGVVLVPVHHSNESPGVLEGVEGVVEHFVVFVESVVEFDFENHVEGLHAVEPEEVGFEMAVHVELHDADGLGEAEFALLIGSIEGDNGGFDGGGSSRFELKD